MRCAGRQMTDQTGPAVLIGAVGSEATSRATTMRCLRAWLTDVLRVSA